MPVSIADIIDLERYPLSDQTLIASCQQQLAQEGLCLLPGFVRSTALSVMLNEAQRLLAHAHRTEHWRATPNGAVDDDSSKLLRATRASLGAIAYDRISSESPLRQLYQWDGLTAFINAVLDGPMLYRTDDALVSCMLTVFGYNDELGWHYDPNDSVVSLLLQEADAGGEFEFAPAIRAPAPQAAARELAVLDGAYQPLIRKKLEPGTLSLFNGQRSLHRVAPVTGQRPRIIALFNYADTANYQFSEDIHHNFFGRNN